MGHKDFNGVIFGSFYMTPLNVDKRPKMTQNIDKNDPKMTHLIK